ncbi:hypothetical protein H0H81_007675 [Sphagnurus paluster]|uniref:Uncharacterized protein n=1 Tax=Sphagnurus paluster TaxID=117069 RepID=A0A9P7FSM1_9AGAR|nr:hypothetical protein H0H81_007675 [Sphagnurus paluster]
MSPRKRSFRRDLFNNTSFASLEDVEAALSELEQLLHKDNYLHVIEDLLDSPLAVELVLSDTFPTSHSAYNASIASKLLLHLSAFFFIFHPPALFQSEATQQLISLYHRGVMATPKLLDALSSMDFEKPDAEVEDADEDEESIPNFFKVKVKVKKPKIRSKQNIGKVSASKTLANLKLLADFHIPIPHDHCEADHAIAKILADAKSILQFYFDTLRVPEVVYSIQQAAISTNPTHAPLEVETQVAFIPSEEKPNSEIPPAYPMVQPMKS